MSESQPASSSGRVPRGFRPPWLPNTSLSALRQEMNDLIEHFLNDPLAGFRSEGGPRIDVCETADAIEIKTDVPGYKSEELHIEVGENEVTISGQHVQEQATEPGERKFHRVERRAGHFSRSVWLPCPVDDSRAEAGLADGVLTVRLPKAAGAKKKSIPVSGG